MTPRIPSFLPLAFPLLLQAAVAVAADAPGTAAQGRQLFEGVRPLNGQIVGHATTLPARASRCINCHGAGTAPPAQGASNTTQAFGPLLNRRSLTDDVPRRGGPPSRYDPAAFCRLLRSGVDPAYVMIPRSMPRYELSDADCQALWAYLTSESP